MLIVDNGISNLSLINHPKNNESSYGGGFYISRIQQISRELFQKLQRKNGLNPNPNEGRIIYLLWKSSKKAQTIKILRKQTGLKPSTLTSILDRMENNGQIKREISKDDKREILVSLTEQMLIKDKIFEKISNQMNEIYYKGLSNQEIANLEKILKIIYTNLRDH